MTYPYGIWTVILLAFVYQVVDGKNIKQKESRSECKDVDKNCPHWESYCESYTWVTENCPKTCGGCTEDVLSWNKYYHAAEISAFTEALAENNDHVKLLNLGATYENRPLQALVFSEKKLKKRDKKPVIMIEAGAHAREWISPAVATYIATQLAEPANAGLLKNFTWVVMPLLNPDGYDYSHTSEHTRWWRKNRRYNEGNPSCVGIDLNRNFGKGWNTVGSSSDECSDVYHGESAFSEEESKAMRRLLRRFKNVELYLSLHSFSQYILYPWGYTANEPEDVNKLKNMADKFSKHISDNGGRYYEVLQSGGWYTTGGGSDDYAYSRGIPYAFCVELPDKGTDGFITPPEKILGISQEVWTGLKHLLGDLVPDTKPPC